MFFFRHIQVAFCADLELEEEAAPCVSTGSWGQKVINVFNFAI